VKKNRYIEIPGGGSVLAGLEAPKVPQSHRQAFTDDQMDAIWRALEAFPRKDRDRATAYVKLLFATGLRKNEARQLALSDLHMDAKRSWVHVRAKTSKGQKERRVRLDQSVLGDLERYINDSRPTYTGPRPEPLFLTIEGKPFTEYGFSTWADRIWDSIERDTGIHGFSHLLRHTWATNFHRASKLTGATVYDLKQQGGWADLAIPMRYTHERPMDEFLDMPTHISLMRQVRKETA
jgi:integrase